MGRVKRPQRRQAFDSGGGTGEEEGAIFDHGSVSADDHFAHRQVRPALGQRLGNHGGEAAAARNLHADYGDAAKACLPKDLDQLLEVGPSVVELRHATATAWPLMKSRWKPA